MRELAKSVKLKAVIRENALGATLFIAMLTITGYYTRWGGSGHITILQSFWKTLLFIPALITLEFAGAIIFALKYLASVITELLRLCAWIDTHFTMLVIAGFAMLIGFAWGRSKEQRQADGP